MAGSHLAIILLELASHCSCWWSWRVMFIKMMAMINYLQHHGWFSTGYKTLYWLFFINSERDLINWALHGIANYCTILVVFFALFFVTFTFFCKFLCQIIILAIFYSWLITFFYLIDGDKWDDFFCKGEPIHIQFFIPFPLDYAIGLE